MSLGQREQHFDAPAISPGAAETLRFQDRAVAQVAAQNLLARLDVTADNVSRLSYEDIVRICQITRLDATGLGDQRDISDFHQVTDPAIAAELAPRPSSTDWD